MEKCGKTKNACLEHFTFFNLAKFGKSLKSLVPVQTVARCDASQEALQRCGNRSRANLASAA